MSQVLYRLYRPQKFADVSGQEHVVKTLSNQLKNGALGHAYLFTGSRGIGKTSIARILARAANCLNPKDSEPDNTCEVCQDYLNGRSLDLTEIDAASHTGVDNIREIIDHLNIPPTRSKYRTFIIDEVHMLSKGAFNALLKTLEEPPPHALFVLATTEAHKIPATIISRTQRFDFRKLTDEQIAERLHSVVKQEGLKVDAEIIEAISQSVDGGMRDALVLLEKAIHLTGEEASAADVQRLLGITPVKFRQQFLELVKAKDVKKTSEFLKELSVQGYNLEQFTKDFLEYLRNLMTQKFEAPDAAIAELYIKAYGQLRFSPITELPLMVAAAKYAEGSVVVSEQNGESVNFERSPESASGRSREAAEKKSLSSFEGSVSQKGLEAVASEHIEVGQVQAKWMDVLTRVKVYNQSLLAALKLAQPVGTVNGSITIAFPYKFHAETVNAAKNRLVVERVFEEVFGRRIALNCVLNKDAVDAGFTEPDTTSTPSPLQTSPYSPPREEGLGEVNGVEAPPEPQQKAAAPKTEEPKKAKEPANNLLNSALEILGGEVVD